MTITDNDVAPAAAITREVWTGISGNTVANIPVVRRRISLTRCRA